MRFAHNREVKSDPKLDIIIVEGTLCNRMTTCVMTFANSFAVIFERQSI